MDPPNPIFLLLSPLFGSYKCSTGFQICPLADPFSSANTTVKGSKGLVSTSDPAYTSLPSDSTKPAAPIDPSSESLVPLPLSCHPTFKDRWEQELGLARPPAASPLPHPGAPVGDAREDRKKCVLIDSVSKSFFISSASA